MGTPNYSAAVKERAAAACDKAGLGFKFADLKAPDNSCSAESASERLLLREKYASKVLLTGERALQEEVTQVRRAAASTIRATSRSRPRPRKNWRSSSPTLKRRPRPTRGPSRRRSSR